MNKSLFRTGILLILVVVVVFSAVRVARAERVLRLISHVAANMVPSTAVQVPFELQIVDANNAGDCKMVGDIDGDGFLDLVLGGMPEEKLSWYRYPDWKKTVIAVPSDEFTTDGALGDVDGDGDLDIVVPDGNAGKNLLWFENPLPTGDPLVSAAWVRHEIGAIESWGKDVELADFDGNGLLDTATRSDSTAMIFFQTGAGVWSQVVFSGVDTGSEGMAGGDIDGDGHIDLVLHGVWLQNPGGLAALNGSSWKQYEIGAAHPEFKALVVDLDQNGTADVLYSSSEGTAPVEWWTPATGDPEGAWISHTILPLIDRAHTLQAADFDLDGDLDVVIGQMHTSLEKELIVMLNTDGKATSWTKQVLDQGGIHNGVAADIDQDGDTDIYGANWTGNPPLRVWYNRQNDTGQWTYTPVTSAHAQTFGLGFSDLDGDGRQDILSGLYWYKNPGSSLSGEWIQSSFPAGMHALLSMDVDGDSQPDVIAQKSEGNLALYWLEGSSPGALSWTAVKIGEVEAASHTLGAQGYRVGQIEAAGKMEIAISSGNGIYYFRIPSDPSAGNWPKVRVYTDSSDEGLALGDIDGDGDLDIAATTGDTKRVEWYENPGNGSGTWKAHWIADFTEAVFPDRIELADLDGDLRLDVIVTEENGEDSGAATYWWKQPAQLAGGTWEKNELVSQATTNSLDAADIDGDGDIDLILGEHRGAEKLAIWLNNGSGSFTEQIISTGKESHLGARTVDLDGDQDLDIVSIAWDEYQMIHLWINERGSTVIPTPPPVATSRVVEDLQVLYSFHEGQGDQVRDISGNGSPVDLNISDRTAVHWLSGGGLSIDAATILTSSNANPGFMAVVQESGEVTLEVWIFPKNTTQEGPARIFTFSSDPMHRNFTIGQEVDAYDVRLRTTSTDLNGLPGLASGNVLHTQLSHVVYTRNAAGAASLYIDGEKVEMGSVEGSLSGWDPSYTLALANELTMDRPWLGELHLAAIYSRALADHEVLQNFSAGPHPVINRQFLPLLFASNNLFGANAAESYQPSSSP